MSGRFEHITAAIAKVIQTRTGCVIVVHPEGENCAFHDLGAVSIDEHAAILGTAAAMLQGLSDGIVESLAAHAGLDDAKTRACKREFASRCRESFVAAMSIDNTTSVELRKPGGREE